MITSNDIFLDQRKIAYLNSEGADQPLKSPIAHEVVERARRYRLARMREQLLAFDCAAVLLYDPVNIRYTLDVSNMQVWTSREATRYALIFADGPAIMFEFKGCHHLCDGRDGIDEVRNSITWSYMCAGDLGEARAADCSWANSRCTRRSAITASADGRRPIHISGRTSSPSLAVIFRSPRCCWLTPARAWWVRSWPPPSEASGTFRTA